ncbi:hypothetical protein [Thalassobacillus devorans]|uniref:hypothetical protein n=1 Tax=Thalassobacillus devorans TaxID=279813 RepID=UPI000A1C7D0E|nr:hypothetical protein [Thalassobacillus devorans]
MNSVLVHIKTITARSRDDKSSWQHLNSKLDAGITELKKAMGKDDSAVKRVNIKEKFDYLLYYANNIAQLYGIDIKRDPVETKLYNKED